MFQITPEISMLFNALGWTLLHSVWQTGILYIMLRICLRIIPDSKSIARYYTTLSFLGMSLVWFALTLSRTYSVVGATTYMISADSTTIETSLTDKIIIWYNTHSNTIVLTYLAILLVMFVRLAVNISMLKNLRKNDTASLDNKWNDIFKQCYSRIGINKEVWAKFSSKVAVPMTMGVLKPIVLIPIALANKLNTDEVEAILLHELAHIKRNDYLVNLLQVLVETILFYNPFIRLISSEIRKEREHCCDDIVIKHTDNKLPYAKALTALESFRVYPNEPALAATGANNHLLNRIKRIMELKNKRINYSQLTIVLVTVMLLIGGAFVAIPSVKAQTKDDKKKVRVIKTEKKTTPEKGEASDTDKKANTKATIIIKHNDDDGNHSEEVIEIEEQALRTAAAAIKTAADALEAIDISAVVKKAMAEVNTDGIDWNISKDHKWEINEALKEIDVEELKAEIARELKEGDVYSMRTGIRVGNIDSNKMIIVTRREQKELMDAQKELEAAKKRLIIAKKNYAVAASANRAPGKSVVTAYKKKGTKVFSSHDNLLNALEKDGLIDRNRSYSVKKADGVLYIDGKKQHSSIYKKYEHLMPDNQMMIKGTQKSISITTEN
ncbi:MAG: M56 family metallopeptidase [Chitinophagales bacterium]|nr:M56 family metallopeptidase [Chitinophagaceae bacterium]MCB9065636.1 M56 family metallopeptidase [Chitinophagales bacterium]